jgi:hypothetical protein
VNIASSPPSRSTSARRRRKGSPAVHLDASPGAMFEACGSDCFAWLPGELVLGLPRRKQVVAERLCRGGPDGP